MKTAIDQRKEWRDRAAIEGEGFRGGVMRFGTPAYVRGWGRERAARWREETYIEHLLPAYVRIGNWQAFPSWRPADIALIYTKRSPFRNVQPNRLLGESVGVPSKFAWDTLYDVEGLSHLALIVSIPRDSGSWVIADIAGLIPIPRPIPLDVLEASRMLFDWKNIKAQGMAGIHRNSMNAQDLDLLAAAIYSHNRDHPLYPRLRTALEALFGAAERWYGKPDIAGLQQEALNLLVGSNHPVTWELEL